MKEIGGEKRIVDLEELKADIADSPRKIEEEFARSTNDWLSCYASRLFIIDLDIATAKKNGSISGEEYERLRGKVVELTEYFMNLKNGSSGKREDSPSEEVKKDLLERLDIFSQ